MEVRFLASSLEVWFGVTTKLATAPSLPPCQTKMLVSTSEVRNVTGSTSTWKTVSMDESMDIIPCVLCKSSHFTLKVASVPLQYKTVCWLTACLTESSHPKILSDRMYWWSSRYSLDHSYNHNFHSYRSSVRLKVWMTHTSKVRRNSTNYLLLCPCRQQTLCSGMQGSPCKIWRKCAAMTK